MKKIVLYPYKMGSEAAKLLAQELGVLRVFPNRGFKPTSDHLVVNWGNGNIPNWDGDHFTFLNRPGQVCLAINKVSSMYRFRDGGVSIPDFTEFPNRAQRWLDYGAMLCARTEVEGFDGSGLSLIKKGEPLPWAPLYTKYVPISKEFRVYVFDGKVIDALEKRKHDSSADEFIRTEHNHWMFCKYEYENLSEDVQENAKKAVKSLGLVFGGVDIVLDKDKHPHVLEVNTAPGIAYRSVERFAEAIRQYAAK